MDKMNTNLATDTIAESFAKYQNGEIYRSVIADTEKVLIEKALQHTQGNQLTAAKILGINRNTLRSKIRKFKISVH